MNNKYITSILICLCIFSCKGHTDTSSAGELIPFRNDSGKWGYIEEFSKQVIIPPIYDQVYPFIDGMAIVKTTEHGKWGILDTLNNYILLPQYSAIELDYTDKRKVYAFINSHSRKGFYDLSLKKEIFPCEYTNIQICTDNYIRIKKNNKYGFAKKDGTFITPVKYDNTRYDFKNNYAIVSLNNQQRIVDTTGKETVLLPIYYEHFMDFDENTGSVIVYEPHPTKMYEEGGNGKIRIIDKEGKTVFYDDLRDPFGIQGFSDGLMVFGGKNGKRGFIDGYGKIKIPYMYDETFGFTHGLNVVTNFERDEKGNIIKSQSAVIDTANNTVIPFTNCYIRIDSDSLFVFISENQKYGLFDRKQKELIPMLYDNIERISDHLFKVKQSELYGVFNTLGKQIQPFKYYQIEEFSEGMAQVCRKGMGTGYIDEKGIETIACKYTTTSPFKNGAARFQSSQGGGFLDKKGREYWIERNE